METKICIVCKNEYPKTLDYFYNRTIKQKLASGQIAEYKTFKSQCKKCHKIDTEKRRIKKRCNELSCDINEYRKKWKEQYSITRTKHPEIKHLPAGVKNTLRKWIDNGYKFTTYEQFRLDCKKNTSKARRKYNYGDVDFVPKKTRNRSGIINLTDSYIAYTLRVSVKDISKELIEQKRLILKLKREIKTTNYGKR